jgi:mono/diheme cytochrome c family protein
MKRQLVIMNALVIGSFLLLSMATLKSNLQDPWKAPAKYEKMANPYAEDADADMIGRTLYAQHCKSCHGSKGKGDGKKAESLDTKVGDFSSASFKEQSDGTLFYKTFFGRDEMPSFSKKINDEKEKWLLINYVRGL